MKWAYLEIQVLYRSGAAADGYLIIEGEKHSKQVGEYGEGLARLGGEGWELVSTASVVLKDGPMLKLFLKKSLS